MIKNFKWECAFNISWYGTSTRIWNTETYSVISPSLRGRAERVSRWGRRTGVERRARERSRQTRSERWYNKRSGERAKEAVTPSALYVSSVWPRMRGRLSLQFSRLGRQLRSFISPSLFLSLSRTPIVSPFLSRKKERANVHVGRYLHVALLNVVSLRFLRSVSRARVSEMAAVH